MTPGGALRARRSPISLPFSLPFPLLLLLFLPSPSPFSLPRSPSSALFFSPSSSLAQSRGNPLLSSVVFFSRRFSRHPARVLSHAHSRSLTLTHAHALVLAGARTVRSRLQEWRSRLSSPRWRPCCSSPPASRRPCPPRCAVLALSSPIDPRPFQPKAHPPPPALPPQPPTRSHPFLPLSFPPSALCSRPCSPP